MKEGSRGCMENNMFWFTFIRSWVLIFIDTMNEMYIISVYFIIEFPRDERSAKRVRKNIFTYIYK